jgi:hypothetical protein
MSVTRWTFAAPEPLAGAMPSFRAHGKVTGPSPPAAE